jgi:hypothetical protein
MILKFVLEIRRFPVGDEVSVWVYEIIIGKVEFSIIS